MSDKSLQTSFLILAALTAIDALTTLYILQNGGVELNPILAPVIDYIIPIKLGYLIVVAAISYATSWACKMGGFEDLGWLAVAVAAAITVMPCVHNVMEIWEYLLV